MTSDSLLFKDFSIFLNSFLSTTAGSFTCVHVNIRSIHKHWAEFSCIAHNLKDAVDVFVLSEINIAEDITYKFSLAGYASFYRTRDNKAGGGLAVFVRNSWASVQLDFSLVTAESLMVHIYNTSLDIRLLAIYRPPNLNPRRFIEEINELRIPSGPFCMIGDVNINTLKK